MAKPIKHNTSSAMSTAGWETAKGAGGGGVVGSIVGTVGGAVAGLVGSLVPAIVVGALAAAVTGFTGVNFLGVAAEAGVAGAGTGAALFGGIVAGLGAAVGAVGGLITGATWGAGIGGMFGLAKGGDKIVNENAKYQQRVQSRQNTRQDQLANANIAGMQDGYQVGFAEGQNYVVNQLRAAQEQMLMAQAQQQGAVKAGHADKIAKQREAQAAAGQQLGA